jgi:hypothetical protein
VRSKRKLATEQLCSVHERDRQPLPYSKKRSLDVVEARTMVEVEKTVNLREVAVNTPCEFGFSNTRRAHLPVQFQSSPQ